MTEIPAGLCECGCGRATVRVTGERSGSGYRVGDFRRFVRGHNGRASRAASLMTERFWSKVERDPDGCWLWLASLDRKGYGQFLIGSRMDGSRRIVRAHRIAYELTFGAIPEGRHLHHICNVRRCVRPDHLIAVTTAQHGTTQQRITCSRRHSLLDPRNVAWHFAGGYLRRRCLTCSRERPWERESHPKAAAA